MLPISQPSHFRFSGKNKQTAKVEKKLLEAGITPEVLKEQWGITLWTVKSKDDTLQLKVDTSKNPKVSLDKLAQWFEEKLQQLGKIVVKAKSMDKCCHKQCKGCLAGDPKQSKTWC